MTTQLAARLKPKLRNLSASRLEHDIYQVHMNDRHVGIILKPGNSSQYVFCNDLIHTTPLAVSIRRSLSLLEAGIYSALLNNGHVST